MSSTDQEVDEGWDDLDSDRHRPRPSSPMAASVPPSSVSDDVDADEVDSGWDDAPESADASGSRRPKRLHAPKEKRDERRRKKARERSAKLEERRAAEVAKREAAARARAERRPARDVATSEGSSDPAPPKAKPKPPVKQATRQPPLRKETKAAVIDEPLPPTDPPANRWVAPLAIAALLATLAGVVAFINY